MINNTWKYQRGTGLLKEHHNKCTNFFNKIEDGEEVYIHLDNPVTEDDLNAENETYIRATLLSDEMISYDAEMLGHAYNENNELLNKYRPYFVSFIIPYSQTSVTDLMLIENTWYKGIFQTAQSELENNETVIALEGILETSASPINHLEGTMLVFKNKSLKQSELEKINEIDKTYKISTFTTSNVIIENYLNSAWNNDYPKLIDIYNVGHGNADYIRGSNNHRILYDVGYSYIKCPKAYGVFPYMRAAMAIRGMKPDCVVLSHWDTDHIIGCAYAEQSLFRKKWIAPSFISSNDKKYCPSINAKRLAMYLNLLGNLCLVDRSQGKTEIATISCINYAEIILWLGGGKDSKITRHNCEGLILEIVGSRSCQRDKNCLGHQSHILLSGDVPYQCIPNTVFSKKIDFLHVPHHCSGMNLSALTTMLPGGRAAIISTDRKKDGTKNLDNTHLNELGRKYSMVVCTIDHKPVDDDANLSVQIDCLTNCIKFR
ncbi:MAG: hypothetical protein PHV18_07815 [Lachnospiraceae bacterium]|nr:hypothetical protein [Lachnospiraceae bacterium]